MCCESSAAIFNAVPVSVFLSLSLSPTGSEMVEAQCQRFEVRSADGERVLFSADEEEISIGTEKLRVTGRDASHCTNYTVYTK